MPALVALAMFVMSAGQLNAAPGSRGSTTGASGVTQALQHFVPSAQTSADEDELQDLQIAPIDPSLNADEIMRSRPFILDAGAELAFPYEVVQPAPLTEDEARDALVRFLSLRGVGAGRIDVAVASFDSSSVQKIVPSPTLRASLLMLTDWYPYEATIEAVLDGENPSDEPYRKVVFEHIGVSGAIATLYEDPRNGRQTMVIADDYEGESPQQLIPVIVHESLHGGGDNSAEEEIIANILDTICYSEVLQVDPEIAYEGTDLAVFNNLELMALLNSTGRGGPGQVGIATSPLGDIFVGDFFGDFDYESIRAVVESDGFYDSLFNNGSPGQQTTAALVGRYPGGKELGKAPWYGEEMLAIIDRGVGKVITPKEAVALAEILQLHMTVGIDEASGGGKLGTKLSIKKRPFAPRDATLFDQRGGKKTGKAMSEPAGRKALAAFLDDAGTPAETRDPLLARYDDPATAGLIPDPALRAATLMLGAVQPWDRALDAIFDGANPEGVPLQVVFAGLRHSAPAEHQSETDGDGAPAAILINSLLAGESPELLASVIVEGTLVHDDYWTDEEALAAALMGTLAYADIVRVDPNLVKAKTWGVINRNRDLLALLNSTAWVDDRDAPSNADSVGFLSAPNEVDDILPGLYADATSFADYVDSMPVAARFDRRNDLVAPPVFLDYLDYAGIEPTDSFRGDVLFSEQNLGEVDAQLGGFLSPDDVLGLAKTLKLGVVTSS